MNNIIGILEGLIFMSGEEGLAVPQMLQALSTNQESLMQALHVLKERYKSETFGFELVEYANRYKFVTKEFVYPYGQKLFEQFKEATLSQAALETLAIIAYKQPITRVEIEEIRGVNCEMMLKKLQARNLIEANERLDVVGKPLLYRVTNQFLDAFQLETLKELPDLPEASVHDEELFDIE